MQVSFFFFYELKKSSESKDSIFKYDNRKFTLEVSYIFVDCRTDTFWYIINILNTDLDPHIWTRIKFKISINFIKFNINSTVIAYEHCCNSVTVIA